MNWISCHFVCRGILDLNHCTVAIYLVAEKYISTDNTVFTIKNYSHNVITLVQFTYDHIMLLCVALWVFLNVDITYWPIAMSHAIQ